MQPLQGLKVLDFCWVVAGPMTTSYLAEYGATVVRVESHRRPDPLHTSPPLAPGKGLNRSGYYANYNANKYALGLNLGTPKGIEIASNMQPSVIVPGAGPASLSQNCAGAGAGGHPSG